MVVHIGERMTPSSLGPRNGIERSNTSSRHMNMPLWVAALATVALAGIALAHQRGWLDVPGLDELELATLDARFLVRGERPRLDEAVTIVGFDDRLHQTAPEVFQRRAGWAKFLDALHGYHPKAVGLDAFFAAPELPLPAEVTRQVSDTLAQLPADPTADSPLALAKRALQAVDVAVHGDDQLAAALRRSGNVLLPVLFFLDNGESAPMPADKPEPPGLHGARVGEGVVLERPVGQRPVRAEENLYSSLPILAKAASGAGSVNVVRDSDGKVRRVYAAIEHGGRLYQHMGLSLAARIGPNHGTSLVSGEPSLGFGDTQLHVDRSAVASLNFLGPGMVFPTISAADVLAGTVAPEKLAGKLVLVGYTDAARDRVATPFDAGVPGVVIHATLVHNILHGELLQHAPGYFGPAMLLAFGAVMTLLQLRRIRQRRGWVSGAVGAVLVLGWLAGAYILFLNGILVAVAAPVSGVVIIALAATTVALAIEGREKASLRAAFGQYVTGSLVEKILDDPSQVRLGGERRQLTVLFSDIRGFSSFSEQMQPDELSSFLNEYLSPMTHLVLHEGGMLDKYIGDAVMAVYGAPLPQAHHAAAACRTALAMQAEIQRLNIAWNQRGLPAIAVGVGINTGDMSVGNMGSDVRFDYTVMGDAVNLASRLEGLTKEVGCAILCGPEVPQAVGNEFVFRELDRVRVKGRGGSVQVYELLGTPEQSRLAAPAIAAYAQALALYRNREFPEAARALEAFLAAHPGDLAAKKLLARLEIMAQNPPGPSWDGVYDQQNK